MNNRGFTTIELLVSIGMLLMVGAMVTAGVRPQMHSAGMQVRLATMQGSTRAAFDLMARDLRMAGYGVDLTMPGVPPPISVDETNLLVLNANFANVRTTGSGAGSTVTVADSTGFAVDNYLTIESFWGGESRKITGVGGDTIQLAQPLSRIYPAGSDVTQIESVRYQLNDGTLLRNGAVMSDGVQSLTFRYYLDDDSLVNDPTGVEANIRGTLLNIETQPVNKPANAVMAEEMSVQAEVRVRNLGLSDIQR